MNCLFSGQKQNNKLIIFFSGWGVSPEIFPDLNMEHFDLLFCHDYRHIHIPEIETKYEEISVIAYSLGVCAASYITERWNVPVKKRIAVNGTALPGSNIYGIPENIYEGTKTHLNEANYRKFVLRMCGNKTDFSLFFDRQKNMEIELLKDELDAIQKLQSKINPFTKWDKAVLSTNDAIFPLQNMQNYWKQSQTHIELSDSSHFPFYAIPDLFHQLI